MGDHQKLVIVSSGVNPSLHLSAERPDGRAVTACRSGSSRLVAHPAAERRDVERGGVHNAVSRPVSTFCFAFRRSARTGERSQAAQSCPRPGSLLVAHPAAARRGVERGGVFNTGSHPSSTLFSLRAFFLALPHQLPRSLDPGCKEQPGLSQGAPRLQRVGADARGARALRARPGCAATGVVPNRARFLRRDGKLGKNFLRGSESSHPPVGGASRCPTNEGKVDRHTGVLDGGREVELARRISRGTRCRWPRSRPWRRGRCPFPRPLGSRPLRHRPPPRQRTRASCPG